MPCGRIQLRPAVLTFTQALAQEFADSPARVQAVLPAASGAGKLGTPGRRCRRRITSTSGQAKSARLQVLERRRAVSPLRSCQAWEDDELDSPGDGGLPD
jgi:hypothetical protein